MSIYRKNELGQVKVTAGNIVQRWNNRIFTTSHELVYQFGEGMVDEYTISSLANKYILGLTDYTEFQLYVNQTNATNHVYIRYGGKRLKLKLSNDEEFPIGFMHGRINVYTLNTSSGFIFTDSALDPSTAEIEGIVENVVTNGSVTVKKAEQDDEGNNIAETYSTKSELEEHNDDATAHLAIRQEIEEVAQDVARIEGRGKSYGELNYTQSQLLAMEEAVRTMMITASIQSTNPYYTPSGGDLVYTKEVPEENTHEWEYNSTLNDWVDNGAYTVQKANNTVFGLVKGDGNYINIVNGILQILKSDYATRVGTDLSNSYTYSQLKTFIENLQVDVNDRYTKSQVYTKPEIDAIIEQFKSLYDLEESVLYDGILGGINVDYANIIGTNFVIMEIETEYTPEEGMPSIKQLTTFTITTSTLTASGYNQHFSIYNEDRLSTSAAVWFELYNNAGYLDYLKGGGNIYLINAVKLKLTAYKLKPLTAENMGYDNSLSGLDADNVQEAIDELENEIDSVETDIDLKIKDIGLDTPIKQLENQTLREVFEGGFYEVTLLNGVRDTIENGYKVQRVKKYVLQESNIYQLDKQTTVQRVRISLPSDSKNLILNDKSVFVEDKILYDYLSDDITAINGYYIYASDVINQWVGFVYELETYDSLTEVQADLVGTVIYYQLATSIETEIGGNITLTVEQMDYWFNVYQSIKEESTTAYLLDALNQRPLIAQELSTNEVGVTVQDKLDEIDLGLEQKTDKLESRRVGEIIITYESGVVVSVSSDNVVEVIEYDVNGEVDKVTSTYTDGKVYEETYTKDVNGNITKIMKVEVM